ncbi:MAG TPA: hypothetical protein VG322_09640 [Candidatus Acidoferrales bacterium]|nr:hypothetical protein [Candidatus Acidoferrales bacterium]
MAFPNRLAVAGEVLVVHRFPTDSLGLISPARAECSADGTKSRPEGLWAAIKAYFKDQATNPVVAVCIPPASKLVLHDIPANLRNHLKVGPVEEVTFTQLSANAYTYRDAVRFENGRELPLQHLVVGQRVKVVSVSSEAGPAVPELSEPHSHVLAR